MTLHDFAIFVYNLSLFPIIFFSVIFLILAAIHLFIGRPSKRTRAQLSELPFVSIQIPTFNDPIAERCVRQCMDFDYPADKYEIIIADDSTNEETQRLLRQFADSNPGFIKYRHRTNRSGFKAGALQEAMGITKGEIVIIFDADWIPSPGFIREIVQPFADPLVALVQTRQSIYNMDQNLITRFAAYVLMVYHTIVMPINNRMNCVFFCGTAGAFRRKHFEEVGGWNLDSLTEDSDLTVQLLSRGYKTEYLSIETPSEAPSTFEGFIKQQMRWCYGNTRVLVEHAKSIFFTGNLNMRQRCMIVYVTFGNIIAPAVVLMTFFGFAGWFIGDPRIMGWSDFIELISKMLLTSGFILVGLLALYQNKLTRQVPQFIMSVLTMGIILSVANSVAFVKALFNSKPHWYCTPKDENEKFA